MTTTSIIGQSRHGLSKGKEPGALRKARTELRQEQARSQRLRITVAAQRNEAAKGRRLEDAIVAHHAAVTGNDWSQDETLWAEVGLGVPDSALAVELAGIKAAKAA